jgi:TrmH family RNA methyltransferase
VLAALADTRTPQGLVAACDLVAVDAAGLADVLARRPRLVAVLAHVRDPGNAGTVIRAADAAGADAVVLTDASVDVHNPKCVRSTAGSLFHLDVVTGVPLDAAVAGLRAAGLRVLAADGAGRTDLDDLEDAGALGGPVAWVLGNEAWGLGEEDRALADDVVRVPIHGRAESLNLAMAATVCLYATARAQRHATAHP